MKIELNDQLNVLNEARHDQKISLEDFRTHRREIIENLQMNSFNIDDLIVQESVEIAELTKEKQSPVVMIVLFSIITVMVLWLINISI